jgi:putative transposase
MRNNLSPKFSGWRSRGYIPHFDEPGCVQVITIRLHDAVPESLIELWKTELNWIEKISASDPRQIALWKKIDKYEDTGYGACWLRDDRIAAMVQSALLYFDGERYRILAWCIMPNHIHVIVEIFKNHRMEDILHSWKSYTAHEANKILHHTGQFWFREYFDREIRNAEHLENAVGYVENNPVKAGIAKTKEEWKWSSVGDHRI